jgi:hypothetical protein
MKKNISLLTILGAFAILLAGALITSSCEGPIGPAGADGADGIDGIDGIDGNDGTDGVAGNAVCLACHTTTIKDAITAQWAATSHGIGNYVAYAGGRYDCSKCHSHEGFVETVWTGQDTTATDIPLPTSISCKTCHSFHNSLDFENEPNSAIRQMAEVALMAEDGAVTVGFDNVESNLCMNCHQSRRNPSDDADGNAPVNVSSTHYGAHHGPQANLLNGYGGYEFGAVLSTSGTHESGADCITCHMHAGDGTVGGHTWTPGDAACSSCHTGEVPTTDVETKLHALEEALKTAGMLDAEGGILTGYRSADSVGALWNYLLIEEDRSMGVHNPAYAVALLDASITALE